MSTNRYSYSVYRLGLLSVLLCCLLVSYAQNIKIDIKAPESTFADELFKVDYIVESDQGFRDPLVVKDFESFSVQYGPAVSSTTEVQFKEGKRVTRYRTITSYYLTVSKAGKYTFPKVEIIADGKKYKAETVKIEVKKPKSEADEVSAFIRTIVSKRNVSLSDTLMLTYRLYTTKEISRITDFDIPDIEGFYVTNITPSRQSYAEESVDGKIYKVVDLKRFVLQPIDIGRKIISEGNVSVEYSTLTGRRLYDMWGKPYDETIQNKKSFDIEPVTIRVQDFKAI